MTKLLKKNRSAGRLVPLTAGMAALVMLVSASVPASAARSQTAYNQVGIRTFGVQRVAAGENWTAANGQKVPASITYTDATGGKTYYLPLGELGALLDAETAWNAQAGSVEIAPVDNSLTLDNVIVGKTSSLPEPDLVLTPEYGKRVGGVEEIDPAKAPFIKDDTHRTRTYCRDVRMQGSLTQFPSICADLYPQGGRYMVFSVTNNGDTEVYSRVCRDVTISNGSNESFTETAVPPGKTLVRVFRLAEDAHPLQRELSYGVRTPLDVKHPDSDVTVSLMHYYGVPEEMDLVESGTAAKADSQLVEQTTLINGDFP